MQQIENHTRHNEAYPATQGDFVLRIPEITADNGINWAAVIPRDSELVRNLLVGRGTVGTIKKFRRTVPVRYDCLV